MRTRRGGETERSSIPLSLLRHRDFDVSGLRATPPWDVVVVVVVVVVVEKKIRGKKEKKRKKRKKI